MHNPPPSHSLFGVQYWDQESERDSFKEVRQMHRRLRCCGARGARAPDAVRTRSRPYASAHASFGSSQCACIHCTTRRGSWQGAKTKKEFEVSRPPLHTAF